MNLHPDIQVFFLYGSSGALLEDRDEQDLIYLDVVELLENAVLKSIKAFQYIYDHYECDFLLRTNLSTFWDWPRFMSHIDSFPTSDVLIGTLLQDSFVSGTDLIVHGNRALKDFLQYKDLVNIHEFEDVALCRIFHNKLKYPLFDSGPRKCFLTSIETIEASLIDTEITKGIVAGADHYRVKSMPENREALDMAIYQRLLKVIYGINQ
jgi:hypothetical protein